MYYNCHPSFSLFIIPPRIAAHCSVIYQLLMLLLFCQPSTFCCTVKCHYHLPTMSGVLGDLSQLPMNIGLDAVPDTIQNGASTGPVMVRAWSHSFQKNNHRMAPMESPMMATLPLFSINPYHQPTSLDLYWTSVRIHPLYRCHPKPSFLSLLSPTNTT